MYAGQPKTQILLFYNNNSPRNLYTMTLILLEMKEEAVREKKGKR